MPSPVAGPVLRSGGGGPGPVPSLVADLVLRSVGGVWVVGQGQVGGAWAGAKSGGRSSSTVVGGQGGWGGDQDQGRGRHQNVLKN